MKIKRDTKTLSLGLAKTNAERQKEHRERIKNSPDNVRLSTYISKNANENLTQIMEEHGLTKREAITAILESALDVNLTGFLNNSSQK